ncbi:PKD domain-containing protein, partial [Flavobacterium sp. XS1P27]|uniref:PKD domain-containing protein n=1 Tax=Flavobacterium sp. XS1P27 TaxID=3401724 RepID=UPI003AABAE81
MKSNFTLLLLTFFLFVGNTYSQNEPIDSNHPDLRLCGVAPNYYLDVFTCKSENYTLKDVFLSITNVNGQPISNTTCQIGDPPQQVYIMLNYNSNANSSVNNCRLFADLKIGNNPITPINAYLGIISSGNNTREIYGPFLWECGQELTLSRILVVWRTGGPGGDNKLNSYNCGTFGSSQCELPGTTTIAKPLAVNFDYKACTSGSSTTVNFTSTTNGGTAPYVSYVWNFGDGTSTTTTIPTVTHTYTTSGGNKIASLKVTDSKGLSNPNPYSKTVVLPSEISLTQTHTNVSCNGTSDASIDLSVSGGTPFTTGSTYTYLWSNGATTQDISGLAAGNYTVTVTDKNGCQKTLSQQISSATVLTLGISSKSDVSCYGASTGSVTAGAVTNAVGTVTYSWKNASNIEVGTSANVSNLPAGTYTLTVTDNCSSKTNSVTISQPDAALALADSSKTDAACYLASTGSVTAGAVTNAVGTVTYSWKNVSNIEVGTSANVSNLPAGTYTLTVTDNCSSKTNSVTISQPDAALALADSSKTDAACYLASTGSVTAGAVTNAVGTVTYSWKNVSNIEVGTSANVSNLPAGTYTLTVTDNCSSKTNSVTISQPDAALALADSSKTDAACYLASTGSVTAGAVTNAVGTVTYSWKN